MPQRTLSEEEFNGIRESVLQGAPDGLSEAEFFRYIGPKFAEAIGVAESSGPPSKGFLANAGEMLNPITAVQGIYQAARHPWDTLTGMATAAGEQFGQAKDMAGQGRYVEAAGHAAAGALPVFGPMAAGIGEQIGSGDVAGGLGKVAGLAAPGVAMKGLGKVIPRKVGPLVPSKLNPAEAAAVDFGERSGIPIDLATKTGSPTARAAQKRVANSIGGEGTAERMLASQEEGLARIGGQLAENANDGAYVSPEAAGAGVSQGVRQLIKTMGGVADEAYGKLRKVEGDPRFTEALPTAPNGSRSFNRILKKMEDGGAKPSVNELYAMRQIEAELDAMPFSKRMLKQTDKGNSYEPVEGVGGAGAPVYHEIGQVMTEGGDMTRAEMQSAIKKTLETGDWTPAARGALEIARKRLKMEIRPAGPSLNADAPLLGTLEDVGLPVALGDAKKALEPIYNRLVREKELGVPMMGAKAKAITALDGILNGPEHASVSVVDAALGDLKSMARTALPELRSEGQGLAAVAVKALDKAVREATLKAGPEALGALEEGRAATVAKYQTGEVFKKLRAEPVKTFRQMTAPKDSGVESLRQVREMAPAKMPDVARAYLEDLMGTATAEGGFARSGKLQAEWQKLGPQTKRLLFPGETQVADLDHFFLLAKRLAENPNPSGTAHVNSVFNWGSTALSYPIAKLLYTQRGVRALSQGVSIDLHPTRATAAAKTAARLALAKAAREAGVDLSAVPAMADQESPESQK